MSVHTTRATGNLCPIPAQTYRGHAVIMPQRRRRRRLVPGRRTNARSSRLRRRTLLDTGRGRVLENMSDLVAAAALACSVLASLALALHAATARPRHGSCQTLITLTRRPLSVSRALHVFSSCVLCLAPPAVDLLEPLGRCVCTRRACCFCLRLSHFCCFR